MLFPAGLGKGSRPAPVAKCPSTSQQRRPCGKAVSDKVLDQQSHPTMTAHRPKSIACLTGEASEQSSKSLVH